MSIANVLIKIFEETATVVCYVENNLNLSKKLLGFFFIWRWSRTNRLVVFSVDKLLLRTLLKLCCFLSELWGYYNSKWIAIVKNL